MKKIDKKMLTRVDDPQLQNVFGVLRDIAKEYSNKIFGDFGTIHVSDTYYLNNQVSIYIKDGRLDQLPIYNSIDKNMAHSRHGQIINLFKNQNGYSVQVGFSLVHCPREARRFKDFKTSYVAIVDIVNQLVEDEMSVHGYITYYSKSQKRIKLIDDIEGYDENCFKDYLYTGKKQGGRNFHFMLMQFQNFELEELLRELRDSEIQELLYLGLNYFYPLSRILVDSLDSQELNFYKNLVPGDIKQSSRSTSQRRSLLVHDKEVVCAKSECYIETCDAAHIVPHKRGGDENHQNLIWLCKKHHLETEDKLVKDFENEVLRYKDSDEILDVKDHVLKRIF